MLELGPAIARERGNGPMQHAHQYCMQIVRMKIVRMKIVRLKIVRMQVIRQKVRRKVKHIRK